MSWKEAVVDVLTTPWAIGSAMAGGILKLVGLAGAWEFVSNIALQFFGPIAIGAGTIAPNVDFVPTKAALGLLVGIAIVVFIVKMDSAVDTLRNRYT